MRQPFLSYWPAGLSYRLRAVGHLFEAEDESQEWPDLHSAIRQAQKTYQADGTMPDWPALEDIIGRVRHPERPFLRRGQRPNGYALQGGDTGHPLPGCPCLVLPQEALPKSI